jgi:hypothetical protein
MSYVESKAFTVIKKNYLRKDLRTKAAEVITKATKLWRNVRDKKDIASYRVVELSNQLEEFRKHKNAYVNQKEDSSGQI